MSTVPAFRMLSRTSEEAVLDSDLQGNRPLGFKGLINEGPDNRFFAHLNGAGFFFLKCAGVLNDA